ncbi:MAG: sulfatase-like hydrolase/transferase [Flavobacteriaceae bacterium]
MNINRPDVFIIVTDSARAFFSNSEDDREKPEFYSSLKDFNYCPNAYCSAPSSVMSGATILSAVDSYLISRNYDDFRFNNNLNINCVEYLSNLGYKTNGFYVARELREKLGKLTSMDLKLKPEGRKFSERMWTNPDLNKIVDRYLKEQDPETPLFNLIWNNIRHDYSISDNLSDLVQVIKNNNRWDNSIIFFLSDHGYPTKDKGITPEGLKRDNKTHDLWLTEDNIRIPFYFKVPGENSTVIDGNVCTTDIFPTIFDELNISISNKYSTGVSLSNKNKERKKELRKRFIRVDSRFIGQPQRKTGIIKNNLKLVYDHDRDVLEYFKIYPDFTEYECTEIDDQNKSELLGIYNDREKLALNFQYEIQLKNSIYNYSSYPLLCIDHDPHLIEYINALKSNSIIIKEAGKGLSLAESLSIEKHLIIHNGLSWLKRLILCLRGNRLLKIQLINEHKVLNWNFQRYLRAFKASIPFISVEPSYLFVRIRELLKL